MKEMIIAREVAEQSFNEFCDEMDIDNDVSKMKEDDAEGFEEQKEIILLAIMRGNLTFNDNIEPVLECPRSKIANPLTFREPTAADYMAMDRQKGDKNMSKMIGFMDSVTNSNPGTCAKLKGRDFKTAQAILVLFMG